MKYFLDFDRTLFETDAFVRKVEADGKMSEIISRTIWDAYDASDFLYEEVGSFLDGKNAEDVFIVTTVTEAYGDRAYEYQIGKVEQEPILSGVSHVEYVTGLKGEKVAEIAKQFPPEEKLVFVDDQIDQCLSVKKHVPHCECFLLVRDMSQIGELNEVAGLRVAHTLKAVDAIIKTI